VLDVIPLYNADLDTQEQPEVVRQFKSRIAVVDALLIATPEYNYSVSGVLKDAIDWASRPAGNAPLSHKTVAIMGASTGLLARCVLKCIYARCASTTICL